MRSLVRIGIVCLVAAMLYAALTLIERWHFDASLAELERSELRDYLSRAFPPDLMPTSEEREPDTAGIERRIHAFNQAHGDNEGNATGLSMQVVRVGPVQVQSELPPPTTVVSSELEGRSADANIQLLVPAPGWFDSERVIATTGFFIVGLLVAALMPQPASINAFPIARDMALTFDRKVSANRAWGAYRLTHLGGGGTLPEMPDNSPEACNSESARVAAFDAVWRTYENVQPRLLRAMTDPSLRSRFEAAMNAGFAEARQRLREDAPAIFSENDAIEHFRPFVQDEALGFALIALEQRSVLANLTRLPEAQITIEPPALWLIGGYEIYYPRTLFSELVEEIHSGLVATCGQSYDNIHVFSDSDSAFVTIDFRATTTKLDPDSRKRLVQYLAKPFLGGLSRMDSLVEGTGVLKIVDPEGGFDITRRKRTTEKTPSGVTNRILFRKIRPEELKTVRKQIKL